MRHYVGTVSIASMLGIVIVTAGCFSETEMEETESVDPALSAQPVRGGSTVVRRGVVAVQSPSGGCSGVLVN